MKYEAFAHLTLMLIPTCLIVAAALLTLMLP
jgi:hypothetical protein